MIIGMTIRKDYAENWERANPVLDEGEFAYDRTHKVIKIGDGITPWRRLKGVLEVLL